jgi:hypothetical protein
VFTELRKELDAVTYENLANALVNFADYKAAKVCYEKAIGLLKPDYSDIKEQIVAEMKAVEEEINHTYNK